MAKFSVHGSEIARLHRYIPSPADPDFAGEDVYFSLRTDGYVLERRTLHWRDGESNRGSWKLHSKIKAATVAERRERIPVIFPKFIRNLLGQGFTLGEGARILRGPRSAQRRRLKAIEGGLLGLPPCGQSPIPGVSLAGDLQGEPDQVATAKPGRPAPRVRMGIKFHAQWRWQTFFFVTLRRPF